MLAVREAARSSGHSKARAPRRSSRALTMSEVGLRCETVESDNVKLRANKVRVGRAPSEL